VQLVRSVGAIYHQDTLAYRSTGQWSHQLPDGLGEDNRLTQARTGMLGARVRDDSIRELVPKLKNHSVEALLHSTPADRERAMGSMVLVYDGLNQIAIRVPMTALAAPYTAWGMPVA
jgi:hypothetical protein